MTSAAQHSTNACSEGSTEAVAGALGRLDLAAVRHRVVLGRSLGLSEVELLAIEHVERAGALSPGKLSELLQLSSGGATKLVQRLQRAGHLSRRRDGAEGRRASVRLTPATRRQIAAAHAPLAQLAAPAVARLTDDERAAVLHVLAAVADAIEQRSDQLVREAAASARDALVARVPADWS
jgi:DNA-binding MarR family transcriptional regulator